MPDASRHHVRHEIGGSALNIGVFTDSYRPYTSGVVRSIETFSRHLQSFGHQVYIFAPSYPNCQPEDRVFRFWAIPAPTQREFTLAVPISFSLPNTMRRLELDIIHVHSPFLLGSLGARVAKRHGLPLVFTYHTLYDKYVHYFPFFQNASRKLVQRYTRDFCNNCNLVVVPTAPVADLLRRQGVKAALEILPTGIDLEDFQNLDRIWLRREYNLPSEARILLFVGRLGKEKNIDFLFHCFARLRGRADLEPLKLFLVGGGPAADELAAQAKRLGVAEDVVFTGNLPKDKVAKCYAGSDLMVFASLTETQGLVLAEAKAAGLPAVVVEANGVRDMINHGEDGYLTSFSLDEFTARVEELLRDHDKRQAMGQRALVTVQPYAARNTAAHLAEHYSELVAAGPRRSLERAV